MFNAIFMNFYLPNFTTQQPANVAVAYKLIIIKLCIRMTNCDSNIKVLLLLISYLSMLEISAKFFCKRSDPKKYLEL